MPDRAVAQRRFGGLPVSATGEVEAYEEAPRIRSPIFEEEVFFERGQGQSLSHDAAGEAHACTGDAGRLVADLTAKPNSSRDAAGVPPGGRLVWPGAWFLRKRQIRRWYRTGLERSERLCLLFGTTQRRARLCNLLQRRRAS